MKINESEHKLLEFSWKWFEFYAKQRTTMFNFYVVIAAIFLNGIILSKIHIDKISTETPIFLSIFAVIISIIFMLLDYRNRQLLDMGEALILYSEKKHIFGTDIVEEKLGFMLSEELNGKNKPRLSNCIRHKFLIPLIYITFISIFLILCFE